MSASVYTFKYGSEINVPEETIGQIKKMNEATDFIRQIVLFNCSKINKNPDNVYVEYYFKTPVCNTVNFVKNRVPLISSVTFLHDSPNVFSIFTDISFDKYKYKKYTKNENNKLFVSEFEKNKHIIYDSTKAVIFVNRETTNIPLALFVSIFEQSPEQCITHQQSLEQSLTTEQSFSITENKTDNIAINDFFNFDFYQKLLYQKNNDCIKFIWMIFDEGSHSKNIEFIDTIDINIEATQKLKNKYGDVIQDIIEIHNLNFKLNRFFQRFVIKNCISKEICKWIIDEAEKYTAEYGWDTTNFVDYITMDIDIIKLKNIQEYFFKYELKKIIKLIEQSYCLPPETEFDITDLNIIRYDSENISGLHKHKDSSFITFNIALNSITEYEGGGVYFDDGLSFKNDVGDMLIHCGKIEHIGIPIKKGLRYILVGFINIKYIA
jgi:hypothetical protein